MHPASTTRGRSPPQLQACPAPKCHGQAKVTSQRLQEALCTSEREQVPGSEGSQRMPCKGDDSLPQEESARTKSRKMQIPKQALETEL